MNYAFFHFVTIPLPVKAFWCEQVFYIFGLDGTHISNTHTKTKITGTFKVLSFTFWKAAPSAVVNFHCQLHCVRTNCTCTHLSTHGCVDLDMRGGHANYWCIAILRQWKVIVQQKPDQKSTVNYFAVIPRVLFRDTFSLLLTLFKEASAVTSPITTLLNHAPGAATFCSTVKLTNLDFNKALHVIDAKHLYQVCKKLCNQLRPPTGKENNQFNNMPLVPKIISTQGPFLQKINLSKGQYAILI